jgi:hypothetical protein
MVPKSLVFRTLPLLGGRRTSHLPITGVRQQKEKRKVSARSETMLLSMKRWQLNRDQTGGAGNLGSQRRI